MKRYKQYKYILLAAALCCALAGCACVDKPVINDEASAAEAMGAAELQAAAKTAISAGEYKEAADYCAQWAALEIANTAVYRCLVAVYEKSGEMQELTDVYETLFKMDAFTEADYLRLAELYEAAGDGIKQREILEYGMLLAPGDAYAPLLDALVVNVSDASPLNNEFSTLIGDIRSGDSDAAFSRLCSKEWKDAVMPLVPGLDAKYRYQEGNSVMRAFLCAVDDQLISHVWLEENGQVFYLSASNDRLTSAKAQASSGVYSGSFEAAYCDLSNEMYYTLTGTLNNSLCNGEYSFYVSWENDSADTVLALWRQAGMAELTHYSGEFKNGVAMVQRQSSVEDGVVYAYTSDEKEFLYVPLSDGESADEHVFDAACFGLAVQPTW